MKPGFILTVKMKKIMLAMKIMKRIGNQPSA